MDNFVSGSFAGTENRALGGWIFQRAVALDRMVRAGPWNSVSRPVSDGHSSRWQYIDALRALSVYCIVLAHCFPSHEHFFLRKIIYIFHVPLYFMVSGYLMDVDRRQPFVDLLWNRFRSILLPFLFFVALLDPVYYAIGGKKLHMHTYLRDIFFFDGHLSFMFMWSMWILPALFVGWLTCYFLFKYIRNFLPQAAICFVCLTVSFLASARTNFATPLPHPLVLFGFLRLFAVIPFLMLGYWFKKYDVVSLSGKSAWAMIAASSVAAIVIGFDLQPLVTINRYIYGNFFLLFISASAALLSLLLISSRIKNYPKAILFFGQNTIFVIVLHHWLVIFLRHVLDMVVFSQTALVLLSFAVSVSLTAALLGTVYFLKKVPLLNMLLGISGHGAWYGQDVATETKQTEPVMAPALALAAMELAPQNDLDPAPLAG